MKAFFTALTIAACLSTASAGQQAQKPKCRVVANQKNVLPLDRVQPKAGEHYRAPLVTFEINEDGHLSNVRIVRSSGIQQLDQEILATVPRWTYKPRPGCGVIETQMSITIDWR